MKKIIKTIICIISIFVFCFSAWKIYDIINSRQTAKNCYKEMKQILQAETKKNNEENSVFSVDFAKLKTLAPDIKGWLHFNKTDISYPVVKTDNNSYYLSHLPDKSENPSGSIFIDYRCKNFEENNNFIIYGHNMKNDTMFGLLDEFYSQDFYERNSEYIYITEEKTYTVKILAGAIVNTNSDIYKVDLNEKQLNKTVEKLIKKSTFISDADYNIGDKIITLSTCGGGADSTRYVLIGVVE